jgi:phage gp46-like protein
MDSRIDPLTGDYDRTRCIDLSNAIYLRVMVPRGSYWADPTFGRRLRSRLKDVERNKVLIIQDTKEALQPLLDDKRADRIDVSAEWNHDGRLYLAAEVYQHGRIVGAFKDYVQVD